ncbi:tetratricopeptide repeat protein [Sphingobium subterraneum]|uniref:Tetratricopeptide repeat protein n=1 Tax=Sphingobium subterraneum TaxID=627688 RepID=A0A841IX81_9SPHN|nr:tetratricopeptide repeat protein [Sphingobium subterraneum]MBB6123237.1 hypothetical protein [Sphingobium subterraneum]
MKRNRGINRRLPSAFIVTAALGLATLSSQGAHAKPKEAASSAASASAAFRTAAAAAHTSLAANDLAGARTAISGLAPASALETYLAASLRMDLAVRSNDTASQRKALADMLGSGAMPAGQEGYLRYLAGYAALQAGASDEGIDQLQRARALGQTDPHVSLLLVDAYLRRKRPDDAISLLQETIDKQRAAGQAVPVTWYDRGASLAFNRKNWPQLARFYAGRLTEKPTPGDWRTATSSYIFGAAPDKEAQLDLIRLQAATGALASERDVQNYATLAAGQGYSAEAKTVIEAGRSNGELSAVDPVTKPLLASLAPKAVKNLAALKTLPGRSALATGGQAAADSGDALLANAQYAEAVPFYRAALTKGGVDASRVNTRLGIALARSGDLQGAQAAFAQAKGPWADVAAYWNAWVVNQVPAKR